MAQAVEEALRESVATKADIAGVNNRIELAVRDMTIRMGAIAVALFAALAAIKFFGSHLTNNLYPGTRLIADMTPSQLWATYIRPMGGKVPSIYGPSADAPAR